MIASESAASSGTICANWFRSWTMCVLCSSQGACCCHLQEK